LQIKINNIFVLSPDTVYEVWPMISRAAVLWILRLLHAVRWINVTKRRWPAAVMPVINSDYIAWRFSTVRLLAVDCLLWTASTCCRYVAFLISHDVISFFG